VLVTGIRCSLFRKVRLKRRYTSTSYPASHVRVQHEVKLQVRKSVRLDEAKHVTNALKLARLFIDCTSSNNTAVHSPDIYITEIMWLYYDCVQFT
jgi:hypothetical protein